MKFLSQGKRSILRLILNTIYDRKLKFQVSS